MTQALAVAAPLIASGLAALALVATAFLVGSVVLLWLLPPLAGEP